MGILIKDTLVAEPETRLIRRKSRILEFARDQPRRDAARAEPLCGLFHDLGCGLAADWSGASCGAACV